MDERRVQCLRRGLRFLSAHASRQSLGRLYEMEQAYEDLVAEIGRIVSSPYPTQLKRLRDILRSGCTQIEVTRWVLSKPCQVEGLACCVLEGLRHWPYVLDIVTTLSRNIKFRDALLREEPGLLHDVVLQAGKVHDVRSNYDAAAIALLSHPLPKGVAMPSEVQKMFIRLFDHAAEHPSVISIKPIYQVLQGTSTLLLGILSKEALDRLEEHIFNILRNNKSENQSLSLYCLAIMKVMSSAAEDRLGFGGSSYDTQELLASSQHTTSGWTPDAMQQFFSEGKAQKTMQLVVLRAMWACTTTTGESFDERFESLVLANDIVAAVPAHLREAWRKANALVVRKLEEKVTAPALEAELRLQSMGFMTRLAEGGICSPTVMDGLRQLIVEPETSRLGLYDSGALEFEQLASAGVLDQTTTTALLQNVVDLAAVASVESMVETFLPLTRSLRQLHSAMAHEESIVEGAMLALDVLSCGQKLRNMAKVAASLHSTVNASPDEGVCGRAHQAARNGLVHELCEVFLKATLSCSQPTYSISRETVTLLLDLHATSAQSAASCSHVSEKARAAGQRLTFVETKGTPNQNHLDWRTALQEQLAWNAQTGHEALIKLFADACGDLEARCLDVERPMREEQESRIALQLKFDELNHAYTNLEAESIDHTIRSNALEAEKDQCLADLEAAREDLGGSTRKVEDLEEELRNTKAGVERAFGEMSRAREAAQLQHDAAFAKKEEELEDLNIHLERQQDETRAGSEELDKLRQELEAAQSDIGALREEIRRMSVTNKDQEVLIDRLRTENNETSILKEQLETELGSAKHEARVQREAHQTECSNMQQRADQELAALNTSHEQKLAETLQQQEETKQGLETKLSDLQDQHRHVQEDLASQLQQCDVEIRGKQQRIERLTRKCQQKDEQIAEANALRSNLMAAMGLNGLQHHRLPHRPSRSSTAQTQQRELESQADPTPPTPRSEDEVGAQQREAGASFASQASSADSRSGPTPKRPRPRKTFKVPSPAKPRLGAGASARSARLSHHGQTTVKRQPLLSVSGNQSHRRSLALKTPSRSGSKGEDLDESTFDGSELFAGTPGQRMMELDGLLDEQSQRQF